MAEFKANIQCVPEPSPEIVGTVDVTLSGNQNVGGPIRLLLNFDEATTEDIILSWGYDITPTTSQYIPTSSCYPPPKTYTNGLNYTGTSCKNERDVTIPSGTTSIEFISTTSGIGYPYGYASKLVLYNITLPTGYVLNLTPVRNNMSLEIR